MDKHGLRNWAIETVAKPDFSKAFDLLRKDARDRWEITLDAPGREMLWLEVRQLTSIQSKVEAIARGDR